MMIIIIITFLYTAANTQLIFIIYKFKKKAWLILRTTPNRYLYSLVFLPIQMFINLYCLKQLCALLSVDQSLYCFLTPHLIAIYTIAFSTLFTVIDYFNGNAGYTDLKNPYNISVIRARDVILKKIVSDNTWACSSVQHSAVFTDKKTAKRVARGKEEEVAFLVNYVRKINTQIKRLTDTRMWSLNLLNVFVFVGSVFWTIGCCLLLQVCKKMGIAASSPQQFETICHLQIISVVIIVLWMQFRGYEFGEFEDIGWSSHEKQDLWLAVVVIITCSILIALAQSSTNLIGYIAVPAIGSWLYNQKCRQLVREFCGAWMSALNLLIIVIIAFLIIGAAYVTIFGTT